MSLREDLAKNRAVFEKLSGTAAAAESEQELKRQNKASIDIAGNNAGLEPDLPLKGIEDAPEPLKRFSLTYRQHKDSFSFEPPGEIEHPKLLENTPRHTDDMLDSLYYQLEADARMASQLNGEEDY